MKKAIDSFLSLLIPSLISARSLFENNKTRNMPVAHQYELSWLENNPLLKKILISACKG